MEEGLWKANLLTGYAHRGLEDSYARFTLAETGRSWVLPGFPAHMARAPPDIPGGLRDGIVQTVKRIFVVPLTVLCIMATTEPADGQLHRPGVTRISVRPDSRLWLEGSSNVRDWTCRATAMDATIEVSNEGDDAAQSHRGAVKGVSVKVPVRMLKCGDRHMEAEMYKALKSPDTAPGFITALIDQIPQNVTTGQKIDTEALLTIAGVQRSVKVSVMSDVMPDGTRRARGTAPILMTDFGIKPPRPWGGLLRCNDRVLIQFEIFVPAQP